MTRKEVRVALTEGAARTADDSLRDNGGAGLLVRHCAGSLCCECRLKRQHGADGLKGGWVVGSAVARLQATALGHGGVPAVAVCTRRRPGSGRMGK